MHTKPKPDKKLTNRGLPRRVQTVPGYQGPTGTPDWLSRPARAAEKRAK